MGELLDDQQNNTYSANLYTSIVQLYRPVKCVLIIRSVHTTCQLSKSFR